ncbi:hypothetical protein Bca4012_031334 [Brassica carinata]|uniref:Uncharacterized protein n=1 Tax=Brassica carinata TaxID=52824 RepID=A0A8X7RHA4_BRACI|nr:hypothetical protein Bca52824_047436 [Brassica carinata]
MKISMSRDMNRREESLSQASTAPFRLWFLHYECFDSLNLRNFLTPSTQIKHDISFNDTHSSSRRCFFTYKRNEEMISPCSRHEICGVFGYACCSNLSLC